MRRFISSLSFVLLGLCLAFATVAPGLSTTTAYADTESSTTDTTIIREETPTSENLETTPEDSEPGAHSPAPALTPANNPAPTPGAHQGEAGATAPNDGSLTGPGELPAAKPDAGNETPAVVPGVPAGTEADSDSDAEPADAADVPDATPGRMPEKIVQLGDSYSAGNGTGVYSDQFCMRSPENYGSIVAREFGAEYTNAACSGAVTADITKPRHLGWTGGATRTYWLPRTFFPTVEDQAAEWQRRVEAENICGVPPAPDMYYEYRNVAPAPAGSLYTASVACHLWAKPQIESVTPDTDTVFLTIGGNDANFTGIVISCFIGRDAGTCQQRLSEASRSLPELRERIAQVLSAIDTASQGNAHVYLLGYPVLISLDSYVLPEGPAGWYDAGQQLVEMQEEANELQAGVVADANAAIRTSGTPQAQRDRFTFVDVHEVFAGHGFDPRMGANQSHAWIVPSFTSFDILSFVHPNPEGWRAEAKVLAETIRRNA
ncbi:SGNH/GDSL hydrolase family protein [Actinobaculum suis]|uniref:SGNH/GDSL hydrolase family protein n=1 Tax=Actinobaculum suis TaxID=1657 RepID=UPI0009F5BF29|nr:SGNH/GDSL hydrolase family protein [Actinobaculum suis]